MNPNLLFEFNVSKETNTIFVKREFNSSLSAVWKAWTTAELLDKWWGPAPWRAETKSLDFTEGGNWLYAMVSPEGERHWGLVTYIKIIPETFMRVKDGFCDENGVMNPEFPQNIWEINFSNENQKVTVECKFIFDNLEDLEMTINMGFKEGFTVGLNQLEALLG